MLLTATPCCITFGSIFDDKKRDALSGSLEWHPNSDLQNTADGLWTHLNDPQIGYNQSYYFAAPDPRIGTHLVEPMRWSRTASSPRVTVNEFQPEMVNNTTNRQVDTYLFGLNASWKPTDG